MVISGDQSERMPLLVTPPTVSISNTTAQNGNRDANDIGGGIFMQDGTPNLWKQHRQL